MSTAVVAVRAIAESSKRLSPLLYRGQKSGESISVELIKQFVLDGAKGVRTRDKSTLRRLDWRSEITSETLCDDLIAYLAPTLEQHKGAAIIDVNPGACLWSSRLHDFLQPSCHLLMEPDERYYEPFIKPLLDKPGSKYRYTRLSGAGTRPYWNNYSTILNNADLFPPRPALQQDDPKLRQIDTSLLVIGNLWRRDYLKRSGREVNVAALILQHMTYGALANDIFHRAGLIRMLWWLPEDRMATILANNLTKKTALNAGLAIGADIVQVAGTRPYEQLPENEGPGIVRSIPHTQLSGKAREIPTRSSPEGRPQLVPMIDKTFRNSTSWPNPLKATCATFEELCQLVANYERERLPSYTTVLKSGLRVADSKADGLLSGLVYPQGMAALKSATFAESTKLSRSRLVRHAICLDLNLQYIHMEAELAAFAERHPDEPKLKDITQLVIDLGLRFDALNEEYNAADITRNVDICLEHLISAYAMPSLVPRNDRPFEPLKVSPNEFWPPQHDMALIMMTPHARDFAIPEVVDRQEGAKICQELMKQLFLQKSTPIPTVLDRIAPNATRDLLPLVPAITDVRKGGRLNPFKVKPKMLSSASFFDLFKAFLDWPFRPNKFELMMTSDDSSSGNVNQDDADDSDDATATSQTKEESVD